MSRAETFLPFKYLQGKLEALFEDLSNWQRIKELSVCGQNRKREKIKKITDYLYKLWRII